MHKIRQFRNHALFEAVQHPTVKQGKNMTFSFKKTRKKDQLLPQFIYLPFLFFFPFLSECHHGGSSEKKATVNSITMPHNKKAAECNIKSKSLKSFAKSPPSRINSNINRSM
jgi:hypothetical protein